MAKSTRAKSRARRRPSPTRATPAPPIVVAEATREPDDPERRRPLPPIDVWRFGRGARLRAPGPGLLSVASLLFLFDSSNIKYGGSIAATIAGEYGNALAITLALWCFARFTDDLDRKRRGPAAGVIGA